VLLFSFLHSTGTFFLPRPKVGVFFFSPLQLFPTLVPAQRRILTVFVERGGSFSRGLFFFFLQSCISFFSARFVDKIHNYFPAGWPSYCGRVPVSPQDRTDRVEDH